jgi:hypothetical protein
LPIRDDVPPAALRRLARREHDRAALAQPLDLLDQQIHPVARSSCR